METELAQQQLSDAPYVIIHEYGLLSIQGN